MKLSGNENTKAILKEIGNRIKDTRIACSMTREKLSEKAGVSLSTVARIESGANVGTEQVINILRALNQLHSIDLIIPEYNLSPVDIAMGRTKKKRASSKPREKKSNWTWGGDKI